MHLRKGRTSDEALEPKTVAGHTMRSKELAGKMSPYPTAFAGTRPRIENLYAPTSRYKVQAMSVAVMK